MPVLKAGTWLSALLSFVSGDLEGPLHAVILRLVSCLPLLHCVLRVPGSYAKVKAPRHDSRRGNGERGSLFKILVPHVFVGVFSQATYAIYREDV